MQFALSTPSQNSYLYIRQAEQSDRDRWKDQVYAAMAQILAQVQSCQMTPAQGYAQAQGLVSDYLGACGQFTDKPTAATCNNYATQADAFPARLDAIKNAQCNKPVAVAPVAVVTPPVTAIMPAPRTYTPPTAGPGCCQGQSNSGGGISNLDVNFGLGTARGMGSGNFGLSFGGGDSVPGIGGAPPLGPGQPAQPAGIVDSIIAAVANAVNGVPISTLQPDSGIALAQGQNVIDFPMRDAYQPIRDVGSPIAGINAWPWRPFGPLPFSRGTALPDVSLPGGVTVRTFNAPGGVDAIAGASSLSGGFGDGLDPTDFPDDSGAINELNTLGQQILNPMPVITSVPQTPIFTQGVSLPPTQNQPSTLQSILAAIPATISAALKQPYFNPVTGQQTAAGFNSLGTGIMYPAGTQLANGQILQSAQSLPYGTALANGSIVGTAAGLGAGIGSSLGTLGTSLMQFVSANPLLILGGVVGAVLLFREPPRRR